MKLLEFDRKFWRQYLISGIVASIGTLIIFSKNNIPIENFVTFGLPMTWIGILILGLGIGIFINWGED